MDIDSYWKYKMVFIDTEKVISYLKDYCIISYFALSESLTSSVMSE
jgi:hypothetical protein